MAFVSVHRLPSTRGHELHKNNSIRAEANFDDINRQNIIHMQQHTHQRVRDSKLSERTRNHEVR